MARYNTYCFNGLPNINARNAENAAKRVYGAKCEIEPKGTDFWEVFEENGYYGRNLLGYMVKE